MSVPALPGNIESPAPRSSGRRCMTSSSAELTIVAPSPIGPAPNTTTLSWLWGTAIYPVADDGHRLAERGDVERYVLGCDFQPHLDEYVRRPDRRHRDV